MNIYKLKISYDGTAYSGWQIQPNGPSIQQYLQEALEKITHGKKIHVMGSGRTDAGVHAIEQVAHFHFDEDLDLRTLLYALNGILPRDIRIKSVEIAPSNFHAQYSAMGKEYHYFLYLDSVMNPFKRHYCWHVYWNIDTALLEKAADYFRGTHDFTSFANEAHSGSAARNPVRTLYRLDVEKNEGGVRLEFEGDGFLYKMVRNIVGTLVEVAGGKKDIEDIPRMFAAKDRRQVSSAAPPQGLFLVRVNYGSG